jgi:hypothetical protein
MIILQPGYFNPIMQYAKILQSNDYTFEVEDNFQKQTYRNRCYIYGANGKQLLNVPIKHIKSNETKSKTRDILIDYNTDNWQSNHLKSLQTAYRSSPYFQFYEDDICKIFELKHKYLLDLNIACHEFIMESLQEDTTHNKTSEFLNSYQFDQDFRNLINAKNKKSLNLKSYTQMFDEKHGFIENLSILDLLFMQGPSSSIYLLSQEF